MAAKPSCKHIDEKKTAQDSFRKITAEIIPKLKNGITSPEIQQELMDEFECVILLVQTEEPAVIIEQVAAMIEEIKELTSVLLNENDELKHKVKELQSLVARHEKEIKTMKDNICTLEGSMIMGQVMSCLERKMVAAILKGTPAEKTTTNITLKQIEKILHGENGRFLPQILKNKEEKAIAKSNWDSLDSDYQLTNSMYPQLEFLKTIRNGIAHPKLTTEEAEDAIKGDAQITCEERNACMQALNTLKKMGVTYIAF